jgi:hypothetical protein
VAKREVREFLRRYARAVAGVEWESRIFQPEYWGAQDLKNDVQVIVWALRNNNIVGLNHRQMCMVGAWADRENITVEEILLRCSNILARGTKHETRSYRL